MSAPDAAPGASARDTARPWWSGRGELVVAALLVALGLVLVIGNLTMRVVGDGGLLGPQGFGWLVAALSFAVAAQMAVGAWRKPESARAEQAAQETTNYPALLTCIGGLVAFTALLDVLGWILAATGLFAAVSTALGGRPVLRTVAIGFILASALQIVFSGALGLSLPAGVVGMI